MRFANFPSNSSPLMPRSSTKYVTKSTKPSSPHLPQQMMMSMFPSFPQPSIDFNMLFSIVSHRSSASKVGSLNSFGLLLNTAILSNSEASGTLPGKCLTKSHNILTKVLEIGPEPGRGIEEPVFGLHCMVITEVVGLVSVAGCGASL